MWRLWCVLALGCVLVGCTSRGDAAQEGPAALDVASLRVTGTEQIRGEGLARLSSDGTRLLWLHGEPCVTALDGSAKRCVDRRDVRPGMDRAEWSPDGTKVVFTNDFWTAFDEPDIWVFDVMSGRLRNLTDDSRDEFGLGEPDPDAHLDLLPSWSPDGRTIRFARGHSGSKTVDLMSVPAEGGPVSPGRDIPCAATLLTELDWSGEHVAWSCGASEPELWLADQAGGEPRAALPGLEYDGHRALSFSPDGQWLLIDSTARYMENSPVPGPARVVPTDGGEPVPVADGAVGYPAWAPGGHAIAYLDLHNAVYVVAEPGGEPRKVHEAEVQAMAAPDGIRLNWTPNAMLILADGELTLLGLAA